MLCWLQDMQLALMPAGSGAEDDAPFPPQRYTGERTCLIQIRVALFRAH